MVDCNSHVTAEWEALEPYMDDRGELTLGRLRDAVDDYVDGDLTRDEIRAINAAWVNDCTFADAVEVAEVQAAEDSPGVIRADVDVVSQFPTQADADVRVTVGGAESIVTESVGTTATATAMFEAESGEYEVCAEVVGVRL